MIGWLLFVLLFPFVTLYAGCLQASVIVSTEVYGPRHLRRPAMWAFIVIAAFGATMSATADFARWLIGVSDRLGNRIKL